MNEEITNSTLTPADIEKIVGNPEEASPQDLLSAYALLSNQGKRISSKLDILAPVMEKKVNDLMALGKLRVNGVVEVKAIKVISDRLVYDQKAMNLKGNESLSAPFREERHVLSQPLIKDAIKKGTFPKEFSGSLEAVETPKITVSEIKKGGK